MNSDTSSGNKRSNPPPSRSSTPVSKKSSAQKSRAKQPHKRAEQQIATTTRTQPQESTTQNGKNVGSSPTSASPAPASGHATTAKPPVVPSPMPVTVPVITYFNHDAQDWLRVGEMVYVTMQATPGGQATFHVGNISGNIALRESEAGQYTGLWTVPANKPLPITALTVVGELRLGDKAAEPMPASRSLRIDALAPTVTNMRPQGTASAPPLLSADLHDEGSGIDIGSLHLRLNGRDVTGSAQVTSERITYTPMVALPAGEQTVELEVRDRAGNKTLQTWHFTVK